jgi:class 3 adenylate cyclase
MANQQNQRILAAIVFTDVVGYSARMQIEEEKTIALVKRDLNALERICVSFDGRVVKNTGDGMFMFFTTLDGALKTATGFLEYLDTGQRTFTPDKRLEHRVGIHLGDVFMNGNDVLGDGVNMAARLMAEAQPDTICISYSAYEFIKNRTKLHPQFIGPRQLKGFKDPITAVLLALRPPLGVLVPENVPPAKDPMNISKLILYIGAPLTALVILIVSYLSLSKSEAEVDQTLDTPPPVGPTTIPAISPIAPEPAPAPATPARAPEGQLTSKTDLLALIDTQRDAVRGTWMRSGNGITCNAAGVDEPFIVTADSPSAARIAFPLAPSQIPREYDLNMAFTRNDGQASIAMIFVSGTGTAVFEVDAWARNMGGIQNVSGRQMLDSPESTFTQRFEPGRRYNVSLRVRKEKITMVVDDKEMASLDTNGSNLSVQFWSMPKNKPLGIGAFKSSVTFHSVDLVPVNTR